MTVRPLDPAVIGEQCEHTEWVPEIESWVRCTANTLMHTPDIDPVAITVTGEWFE